MTQTESIQILLPGDKVSFNFLGYTITGILRFVSEYGYYVKATDDKLYFIRHVNKI